MDIAPPEPPYQPDEIYDALKQGEVLGAWWSARIAHW
ncbi:hypothetical protein ACLK1S_06970 [Escherichia coli]